MARSTINVTDTFQQIATGMCSITVKSAGLGSLSFNETASDTDSTLHTKLEMGHQFVQNEAKATYVKSIDASDGDWVLVVDEV